MLLQALDQDLEREDARLEGLDHDTRVRWGEMLKHRRETVGEHRTWARVVFNIFNEHTCQSVGYVYQRRLLCCLSIKLK
jgi:hypothetical protein